MKKVITLLLLTYTLVLLSACQLVKESTINKEVESKKVIGIKLQAENEDEEYFRYNYDPKVTVPFENSPFFSGFSSHSIIGENNKETVEVNYYTDLDQVNCLTLSYLLINEKKEISEGQFQTVCDMKQATLTHESNNDIYKFIVNFVDIEYLESYQVIQYDEDNDKISETTIQLIDTDKINIIIGKNTDDYIIIEKYRDHDNNTYYNRTLHTKAEIEESYNSKIYLPIIALTENKEKIQYIFEYTLDEEEVS